jgi:hypothetical protein
VGILVALALGALALIALPGAAVAKDRNHDHIPDRWEKRHDLSLNVNQAGHDQDRDHLRNRAEFLAGDNPRDRDSDDDGVLDGQENGGTIASFDSETGKLTLSLFGGETLTGMVTEATRIKCEDEHFAGVSARSGEPEPGDDHGGHGEEPGDDNGGHGEELRSRRRRRGQLHHRRPDSRRGRAGGRAAGRERPGDLRGGRAVREGRLGARVAYLASSQSWPTPMSTSSGGSSW